MIVIFGHLPLLGLPFQNFIVHNCITEFFYAILDISLNTIPVFREKETWREFSFYPSEGSKGKMFKDSVMEQILILFFIVKICVIHIQLFIFFILPLFFLGGGYIHIKKITLIRKQFQFWNMKIRNWKHLVWESFISRKWKFYFFHFLILNEIHVLVCDAKATS